MAIMVIPRRASAIADAPSALVILCRLKENLKCQGKKIRAKEKNLKFGEKGKRWTAPSRQFTATLCYWIWLMRHGQPIACLMTVRCSLPSNLVLPLLRASVGTQNSFPLHRRKTCWSCDMQRAILLRKAQPLVRSHVPDHILFPTMRIFHSCTVQER